MAVWAAGEWRTTQVPHVVHWSNWPARAVPRTMQARQSIACTELAARERSSIIAIRG